MIDNRGTYWNRRDAVAHYSFKPQSLEGSPLGGKSCRGDATHNSRLGGLTHDIAPFSFPDSVNQLMFSMSLETAGTDDVVPGARRQAPGRRPRR